MSLNLLQLKKSMLFQGMKEEEILLALDSLTWYEKRFNKDEIILRTGTYTDSIGFIQEGSAAIQKDDFLGNTTVLSIVPQGQFFAESYAMLKDEMLMVDVVANEKCRILFIRIGGISDMLRITQPWMSLFIRNLLQISTRKNLALSRRSFYTAPKSARGRILAYLSAEAVRCNSSEIDIPFNRQQMADYLNLDRTALSKELGRMREEGLLTFHKNHFHLFQHSSR